jgi:hypothetical protein
MLYRERITGKATGTSLTLFSKEIKPGWQVTIEHIGFKANVAATRTCRIYLEGHGYNHYLEYHSVENGISRRVDIKPVTIDDNERLAFDFVDVVADEEFEVYLTGNARMKG